MNSQIANEVRTIFLPCSVMTLAGLAPLLRLALRGERAEWLDAIAIFGFFGGAAVLVAISFRRALEKSSFTFLSDAASYRNKLWREKMMVLTVAVVISGLLACVVQIVNGTIVWSQFKLDHSLEPVLLLAIIVCSVGFWTMLARSVIGGLLLAAAAQFGLYLLLVLFVTLINRMARTHPGEPNLVHNPDIHAALSWFIGGFALAYSGIMLWLGRRKFAMLQPAKAPTPESGRLHE